MEPESAEVHMQNGQHDDTILAVFRMLDSIAALRAEAAAAQVQKKAPHAPGEGEPSPGVRRGKKHTKERVKREVQQLLASLEFVLGDGQHDDDYLQARLCALFHRRCARTLTVLSEGEIQLYTESLQAYLEMVKAQSVHRRLGQALLQYLVEHKEDPVRPELLAEHYVLVGGAYQLSESSAGTRRSSTKRQVVRGSLAILFPAEESAGNIAAPTAIKTEAKGRKRKTRRAALELAPPPQPADGVRLRKRTGKKLKNSWRASMDILRLQRGDDAGGRRAGSTTSILEPRAVAAEGSHKRSKSNPSLEEDLILRPSSPAAAELSASAEPEVSERAIPRCPSPSLADSGAEEESGGDQGSDCGDTSGSESSGPPGRAPVAAAMFVRVLRVQEGTVFVAVGTQWPQDAVAVPLAQVQPLHAEFQSFLGSARSMEKLAVNPLEQWFAEVSRQLKTRMEMLLEEHGVDVARMKQAAKQQEGDIKTLRFLLQCKRALSAVVAEPPAALLAEMRTQCKAELEQLSASGTPAFLPTRAALEQYLTELDYGREAMRIVTANLQCVDTAIEQVGLEKVRLLNGTRKDELSRWWLRQVSQQCSRFLRRIGFVEGALPDNYIETRPTDLDVVRRNLHLVVEVLDPAIDRHGVRQLVDDVKLLVYARIDTFLEESLLALAVEFGQLDEAAFTVERARECLAALGDECGAEQRQRLENNIKDVEYLFRMQQLEQEDLAGQLQLSDVVPVSGLVMSAFHRHENVLKTVLELWGSTPAPASGTPTQGRARALSRVPNVTPEIAEESRAAFEAERQEMDFAFEDIGGDSPRLAATAVRDSGDGCDEPPTLCVTPVEGENGREGEKDKVGKKGVKRSCTEENLETKTETTALAETEREKTAEREMETAVVRETDSEAGGDRQGPSPEDVEKTEPTILQHLLELSISDDEEPTVAITVAATPVASPDASPAASPALAAVPSPRTAHETLAEADKALVAAEAAVLSATNDEEAQAAIAVLEAAVARAECAVKSRNGATAAAAAAPPLSLTTESGDDDSERNRGTENKVEQNKAEMETEMKERGVAREAETVMKEPTVATDSESALEATDTVPKTNREATSEVERDTEREKESEGAQGQITGEGPSDSTDGERKSTDDAAPSEPATEEELARLEAELLECELAELELEEQALAAELAQLGTPPCT